MSVRVHDGKNEKKERRIRNKGREKWECDKYRQVPCQIHVACTVQFLAWHFLFLFLLSSVMFMFIVFTLHVFPRSADALLLIIISYLLTLCSFAPKKKFFLSLQLPAEQYEHMEAAIDCMLQLCRLPSFLPDLYLNFTCNLYCDDLFSRVLAFLSLHAHPEERLLSQNLTALECLLVTMQQLQRSGGKRRALSRSCDERRRRGG